MSVFFSFVKVLRRYGFFLHFSVPYGIRESAETIGSTKIQDGKHVVPENEMHIPSKIEYDFSKMLEDLFKFSLTHLKVGGRLVTWLPVLL